ncbi:MAG: hypothetical protein ACRD98_00425 [Nitrososphaera sp.]
MMTREELETKKRGELFVLCKDVGVTGQTSDRNEDLIQRILGAQGMEGQLLNEARSTEPQEPQETPRKKQADKSMIPEGQLLTLDGKKIKGRQFRVTIFSTETDKSDVLMAVNGYGISVQRNKEVVLDECFVEVLKNSVITTTEQHPDTGVTVPVTRLTYPHQAVPL